MMKPLLNISRLWLVLATTLLLQGWVSGAKTGRSNLTIRHATTKSTEATIQVGQTIPIELWIEGDGEQITGSSVFLSFDDAAVELVPTGFTGGGLPIPFTQGGFIRGVIFDNRTLGDQIGNSNANGIPLFQLHYFENIQSTPFGNANPAIGNGRLASFSLRVVRKPASANLTIRVDAVSPVGSETGYFKPGDPGTIYTFKSIKQLTMNIKGLDLAVSLPDLYLLPGQVDNSIDLDDLIDDPTIPDANLNWTNSTPDPNSINVTIDPVTHVVTVDPLTFIGISEVTFTVDDGAGSSDSDNMRVIVDSPPVFDDDAILDNLRFDEDTVDTTLVLVATDPDIGAMLTYAPDSTTAADTKLDVAIDQTTGRVTLTPDEHYYGSETMTFTVTDQFGLADTVAVDVIIDPVNDPPEWLVKPLPPQNVGLLGRAELDLASRVIDVDDDFTSLQFTFGGADSIAFDVINNNATMTITPVRPFMGVETVTVVVTDTSEAADVTTLRVEVLPPADPQPPEVGSEFLKVDVVAGGPATHTQLDDHVSDLDHDDSDLVWAHSPVSLVTIDPVNLAARTHSASATAESTGYEPATLTVTDPTALQDTLAVRIYASSITTGVPVVGGLPDLVLAAGNSRDINLDNYSFDADHSAAELDWEATGQQTVAVTITDQSNIATVTAPSVITNQIENVIFTVIDPDGQSDSDTIRVTLVPEGGVVVDFSTIGGARNIGVGIPDTLALDPFVVVGTLGNIVWTTQSQDGGTILAQILDRRNLQLIGLVEGSADVTVTARDTTSNNSSSATIRVTASRSTNPGQLAVRNYGALTLRANRDTTIELSPLVTSGNAELVTWSSTGNVNVGVEIDNATNRAILRPVVGFVGDAGPIVFSAREPGSQNVVVSTAAPVTVQGSPGSSRGLLDISLIPNPIRKNFVDAFVVSRRALLSVPIVEVKIGVGADVTPTLLRIERVDVSRIWVGDFVIDDATTGTVQITATGITEETRIALTDTARIVIGEAGIASEFEILNGSASLSLASGSLDPRAKVALFETSSTTDSDGLIAVSPQYVVHSTTYDPRVSGHITLTPSTAADERVAVYRRAEDGGWDYVDTRIEGGRVIGDLSSFGTYGAFLDELGIHRISDMTLHANFPNPFNPQTQIRYDIAEYGDYQLLVYNILGQQVRSLVDASHTPGVYRVTWDAHDDAGQAVGAGVYLYRLESDRQTITRKMLLLK